MSSESRYVTRAEAAEILGMRIGGVDRMLKSGKLVSRGAVGPGRGGLERRQVEQVAARRALARQERARAAELKAERRGLLPPDDVHDWIRVGEAAALLGVSSSAVSQRCRHGTIPHVEQGDRRWLRRDLLEMWQRARSAQSSREP